MSVKESIATWLRFRFPWLYEFICWNLPLLRGTHASLLMDPSAATPTWSARRINALNHKLSQVNRYLEVGVQRGTTFQAVQVIQAIKDVFPMATLVEIRLKNP